MSETQSTILCISSYFKGNRFLQQCRRMGCKVILLTIESLLKEPWARESIDEVFAMPSFHDRRAVINAVSYLARTRSIDRIAPLDDFDVELAAVLREHLRMPGMGDTTARYFRDKLAMRDRARNRGILVPDFVHTLNHEKIAKFLQEVKGPWVLKPRSEASAVGIKKIYEPSQLWSELERMGDDQSFHLLEKMIPGDVYHVDSLVWNQEVIFTEVSRYRRPILEVSHEGGIFATATLERKHPDWDRLTRSNREVLKHFGLKRGVAHTEFIKGAEDGEFYFLETAARVGGAGITDLVEASTGLNLWEEWARIEIAGEDHPYELPAHRAEYAGLIVSLTRQEWPDSSQFNDPEVVHRMSDKKYHLGLVVRSPEHGRVHQLIESYIPRIQRDYHAALPPSDRATA